MSADTQAGSRMLLEPIRSDPVRWNKWVAKRQRAPEIGTRLRNFRTLEECTVSSEMREDGRVGARFDDDPDQVWWVSPERFEVINGPE